MKVQVVDVSSFEREVEVELPPEVVRHGFDHVFLSMRKSIRVPGFRKGKVPRAVILQRYRQHVEESVVEHLVEESFGQALARHGLVPVNQPIIDHGDILQEGIPFKYTLRFEVMPKVDVTGYEGVSVEGLEVPKLDERVQADLERRRQDAAELCSVEDRAAQAGDVVTFDYSGQLGGEDMEPRAGATTTLGEGEVLEEIDTLLMGCKPGDALELDHEFGEDDERQGLSGKQVKVSVSVTDLQERVLPELDDEFARDLDFDDLEALKVSVQEKIAAQAEEEQKREVRDRVVKAILEVNDFEIPPSLIKARTDENLRATVNALAQAGMDVSQAMDPERMRDEVRERVIFETRRQLLLEAVGRAENIEVAEADIDARLQEIAGETGQPLPKVRAKWASGEGRSHLEHSLKSERVLDFLVARANIDGGSAA